MATESDNVNSGALGTLLAVGTVATLGVALVVTALVRSEMADEAEKKEVGADRPYRDLVAEQTAKMAAPATYVDRGHGIVSLPIDRAMEVTVAGLIKDPNSATPPATGGTGGAAATAAGGSAAELGGTGGSAPGEQAKAGEAAKPAEGAAPAPTPVDEKKKDEKKKDEKKKDAPKPHVPAAPVPAAPAPAPNGQ